MGSKLSRFIVVGLLSNLINYLAFYITYTFSENIVLSSYLGYFLGLINSYILGKKWVFNVQTKISFLKKFLYLIVYFIGGTIMSFIIFKLQGVGINYKLSWFIGANFAFANNFLCSKYIIFNNK